MGGGDEVRQLTPINRKKYSCYGLKKTHTRNLITKKNSCGSKIPNTPPPGKFLLVESEMRENFPVESGIQGFGIWNMA